MPSEQPKSFEYKVLNQYVQKAKDKQGALAYLKGQINKAIETIQKNHKDKTNFEKSVRLQSLLQYSEHLIQKEINEKNVQPLYLGIFKAYYSTLNMESDDKNEILERLLQKIISNIKNSEDLEDFIKKERQFYSHL